MTLCDLITPVAVTPQSYLTVLSTRSVPLPFMSPPASSAASSRMVPEPQNGSRMALPLPNPASCSMMYAMLLLIVTRLRKAWKRLYKTTEGKGRKINQEWWGRAHHFGVIASTDQQGWHGLRQRQII